ncbi:spike base protein, RCAP_Rcc01079 family [Yoonia sediminilitoris]|uniref:Uncharacterized protein n=1 Tax=Yoonia sediminilitoris TaxID=1286148 RepID=A0A2T6KBC7_9RHOB|nr:hypothetical protein [Yoonia sediminilitoris]PUB12121.1 hypothetical protein C8N45_11198 [Yoonia sediminilitoris]RCW92948.1 hypothetical protein DFP92_11197 [Yoonia sediminilitoris]
MPDLFDSDYVNLTSPAVAHYVVSPSDMVDLPTRPRAFYVNTGGTAVMRDGAGDAVSYEVAAGAILTLRATRVLATGTTAQLIAWY